MKRDDRELTAWLRRTGPLEVVRALATLLPGAAVVLNDGEGRVLMWSPEAERLFGWTDEDVLGEPAPRGVLCDDEERVMRPFGARVAVLRKDGSSVRVQHWARRFGDDGAVHVFSLDAPREAPAEPTTDVVEFHGLVTRDPGMKRALEVVHNVAETEATVLVRGESGTGKELVARAVHLESGRRDGPFVAVNCAAFTPTLLESELFGHVKGAFTGATQSRKGIFAQADGGTLFLDEVAELDPDLQSKLLRVLQERTFVPVGGTAPVHVDVRIVAATHRSLREEVRAGRFREDLLYRLRVVPIFLPPLRDRPGDVELLLTRFLDQLGSRGPRRVSRVAPDALRALVAHRWPGNVRELVNVVEYALAVGRGPELSLDDLPPEFRERRAAPAPETAPGPGLRPGSPDEVERVRTALEEAAGDLTAAAAKLGVSRATFWRMRKRAGL